MRTIGDIVGLLLIVVGILSVIGGCSISTISPGGGVIFWIGVLFILAGWLISRGASSKTCPHCQERINHKATKCKHCQSALA